MYRYGTRYICRIMVLADTCRTYWFCCMLKVILSERSHFSFSFNFVYVISQSNYQRFNLNENEVRTYKIRYYIRKKWPFTLCIVTLSAIRSGSIKSIRFLEIFDQSILIETCMFCYIHFVYFMYICVTKLIFS